MRFSLRIEDKTMKRPCHCSAEGFAEMTAKISWKFMSGKQFAIASARLCGDNPPVLLPLTRFWRSARNVSAKSKF
jgi:hypothetical protein